MEQRYVHYACEFIHMIQPSKHTHRPSELYFPEFVEFIARCGLHIGERYPFNEQYPTAKAKIIAIFKQILLHDASRLSRKLSSLMLNTRAPPEKLQQIAQAAMASATATSETAAQYGPSMFTTIIYYIHVHMHECTTNDRR